MAAKDRSPQYLALLRGINVGGNNIVRMAELSDCFERLGLDDVATYIQSGNVVFRSGDDDVAALTSRIEAAMLERFGFACRLVVLPHAALKESVQKAPRGFGSAPAEYRYDVIFLKPPLTAKEAVKDMPTNPDVDRVTAGGGVLYFSRLISKAAESKLGRVVQLPVYRSMTIRNWNTTTKLLTLMEKRS